MAWDDLAGACLKLDPHALDCKISRRINICTFPLSYQLLLIHPFPSPRSEPLVSIAHSHSSRLPCAFLAPSPGPQLTRGTRRRPKRYDRRSFGVCHLRSLACAATHTGISPLTLDSTDTHLVLRERLCMAHANVLTLTLSHSLALLQSAIPPLV